MNEVIKQFTRNINPSEAQSIDIIQRLSDASTLASAKAILDALVEYVLAEPYDPSPVYVKFTFVQNVIKQIVKDQMPIALDDLVQMFTRVLDAYTTGCWHLNFLQTLYQEFSFGKSLCSTPPKIHLIEQFFASLQKKIFINKLKDDDNKWQVFLVNQTFCFSATTHITVNDKEIMRIMRKPYQELYRCAIRNARQSSIWLAMVSSLTLTLTELFDSYDQLTDAQIDLILCPDDITFKYVGLLVASFAKNVDIVKTNYVHILDTIERLIAIDKLIDASNFIFKVLVPHLPTLDIALLLQTSIRICSSLTTDTVERRKQFCNTILYYLAGTLRDCKASKTSAPLFFDLILVILKLFIVDAPASANLILTRSEFFPWKELGSRVTDLIRICSSYDAIVYQPYFSNLSNLENIVKLIGDRIKHNRTLFQLTHEPALDAVLRWSDKNSKFSVHVYKMGGPMLQLIDEQRVTIDTCLKFTDALHYEISTDHNDDDPAEIKHRDSFFFLPMSARLGTFIEQFKTISHEFHQRLATLFMIMLDRPLTTENGYRTFSYSALLNLWNKTTTCLVNEDDARLYEMCLDRMYTRVQNDDERDLQSIWIGFWIVVGIKLPQVAVDHVEQLLTVIIDRKDMSSLSLVSVS